MTHNGTEKSLIFFRISEAKSFIISVGIPFVICLRYNRLTAFQIYDIEPLFHGTILGLFPYFITSYQHSINGFLG